MNRENDAKTCDQDEIVPNVTRKDVPGLAWRLYGLQTEDVERLPSYQDVNWYFRAGHQVDNAHIPRICTDGYVLKVLNTRSSKDPMCIEAMYGMMKCARNAGVGTQDVVLNKNGKYYSLETFTNHFNGTVGPYIVRLLTFVPGKILLHTPYVSGTFRNIGQMVGKLHQALKDFHHPYYDTHITTWDLAHFPAVRNFLSAVHDDTDRRVVAEVLDAFENDVKPEFKKFRKSVIHGDVNDHNLVMRKVPVPEVETDNDIHDVAALIDFDDASQSYAVMDVAIAITYISLECPLETQLAAGGHFLSGYYTFSSLNDAEKRSLKTLVCARLCQSLVYNAHEYSLQPSNAYLLGTVKQGWPLLYRLWRTDETELYSRWREIVNSFSPENPSKHLIPLED